MLFSSHTFLFVFLPIVLLLHTLLPARARNGFLLAASLIFYAWGETVYVAVMLGSIAFHYGAGLALAGRSGQASGRIVVAVAVAADLLLLCAFKYASFFGSWIGLSIVPGHLPLGISFFTFQALSYVVDVYRGRTRAQRSPVKLALFIALFPQLIAGPIVRYTDLAAQLVRRRITAEGFADGIRRFTIGLAKKVLIANSLAVPADRIFALPPGELASSVAWFGVACYTLQIYFDFSGYSDMAIGLGRMLGFRLPENFRFPYLSKSVTEFWRRWHISLSTWFRDYLYFSLGGSRGGAARTARNLIVVFLLCGLWHGASFTFIVWGAYHGAFLSLERLGLRDWLDRQPAWLARTYLLLVVMVGWVFFRAEGLGHAVAVLGALAGLSGGGGGLITDQVDGFGLLAFLAGMIACGPWAEAWLARALRGRGVAVQGWAQTAALAVLWTACAVQIAGQTYEPFIYFRF